MKRGATPQGTEGPSSKKRKVEHTLTTLLEEIFLGVYPNFQVYRKKNNIFNLDLRMKVRNRDLEHLFKALKGTLVQSIDLSLNGIQLKDIQWIIDGLEGTYVTSITLSMNGLNNEAVTLRGNSNLQLRKINLSPNLLGAEGTKAVIEGLFKHNKHLQSIDLSSNNIGNEGAKAIANWLKSNPPLRSINLSGNGIRLEGAELIMDSLKSNTFLQSLNLSGNRIGSYAIDKIGKRFKDIQLESLELGHNDLSDSGAKEIAEGLKQAPCLKSINLRGNGITNSGAISIAKVLTNSPLQSLDLSYNSIRDDGANAIGAMFKDSQLQCIHLEKNLFNEYNCLPIFITNIPYSHLISLELGLWNNLELKEALALNRFRMQKISAYAMASLPFLSHDEKSKYTNLPALQENASTEESLRYAGGILMNNEMPDDLRALILSKLPNMSCTLATNLLTLANQRHIKNTIEDVSANKDNAQVNHSRLKPKA